MEGSVLTSSDLQALKEVTLFYSASSCLVLTLSLVTLYGTGAYLQAGKASSIAPMLAIFASFELVKWYFNRLIYNKDLKAKGTVRVLYLAWKNLDLLECIKSCFALIVSCGIFYVLAVIFGAEIGSKYEETLMFSCLLSVLTIYPMCLHLGRSSLNHFFDPQTPVNKLHWILHKSFEFTLLGAWLGATVIPLDWNRPWQEWPVSCSFGAIIGYTTSHYYALAHDFTLKRYKSF